MPTDIIFVSCSNSSKIMSENLLRSPDISSKNVDVIVLNDRNSASQAYADVISTSPHSIFVFAHQDVYFPKAWAEKLRLAIRQIEAIDPDWAVIGAYGMRGDGRHFGYLYDTSMRCILGHPVASPERVSVLDEIVLIVRGQSGITFDAALPGFHMYGTDIALTAREKGLGVWVADLPVVHNSTSITTLDANYGAAWRYVSRKWKKAMPVPNLICKVMDGSDWPLWKWRIRNRLLLWRGKRKLHQRVDDPTPLARASGLE